MKILVTSGGTKIPIDRVRDITNMSKGTFGSKIATELLLMGHDVLFFAAERSRSPFKLEVDLLNGEWIDIAEKCLKVYNKLKQVREHYREYTYKTFDEYRDRLERIVRLECPDVVILAAAVSDYGVDNPVNGKIRSNDMLTIKLSQLPKIIYYIKEWHSDCKLVGFKLLVDSKDYQLIEAADRSIADNKCDMIVANDLQDIKEGKHRIHLVFPDHTKGITYKTDLNDPNYLARMVAEHSVKL